MLRWHDIGLVVLGLVAAALVYLTFRAVDALPEPLGAGPQPLSSAGGSSATGTAAPSGGSQDGSVDGDPATSTGSPGSTGPSSSPSRIAQVRPLLDGTDRLVVQTLGDSTGNETWEWVFGWGRLLAETRPVTVAAWNEWSEAGYVDPVVLSEEGEGGPVVIYSGHQSGATADYPVGRLDDLVPEAPDLVILNYGHNNALDDVRGQLASTLEALREQFGEDLPVVVTLQQPQSDDANADVRDAVRDFAEEQELGWIDVAAAFAESGDPEALLADALHPNEEGAEVWTQAVARTLRAP